MESVRRSDVLILGAGAAGLMAGIEASRAGARVTVLDHARAPGEKIRISGGGRCNFTNLSGEDPARYLSANPKFALSALRRFTPRDFIARVGRAGIAWHEKTLGQLFCDGSATQIVRMLVGDFAAAGGDLRLGQDVAEVGHDGEFTVATGQGVFRAGRLIVATGGRSVPKMGATGLAYRIAERFGLAVSETRPGLVPLTFSGAVLDGMRELAGVSVAARVACRGVAFEEGLLFTHRGLSGPSILQVSSFWREGDGITVDLAPGFEVAGLLKAARREAPKAAVRMALARVMPERLAAASVARSGVAGPMGAVSNVGITAVAAAVHGWEVTPAGSEGWRTAEVTVGGVDTGGLDARTMQAKRIPGLYVVGEAVDVTGWLGGYNFQWAWASGWAAGRAAAGV
ncbi:MAG: NAD(P)/FAD-dependent oxidoreductase [Paracoccaceae bacterium]